MHQLPHVVYFLGWVWGTGVGGLKKKTRKKKRSTKEREISRTSSANSGRTIV
jgi:hypothetical protein